MVGLKKAGSNWVDGDRFFDRDGELEVLTARVQNGTHTLLTAQRRMGKTSLVRELLRRLAAEGHFETVFVDLEDVRTAADAVVEIGVESRHVHGAWDRIKAGFANILGGIEERIDTLSVAEVRVKLRAGIDPGSWRQKGDAVCAALAKSERPVVLALDELPILVNRMLKDHDYRITPAGKQDADEFLSWLRKIGQDHRDRICLILSGSIGLEPILHQAGLSAHANIFSPLDLKPWRREDRARLPCRARGDMRPRPAPRCAPARCAAGCGAWFPTTCSGSSTASTRVCAWTVGAMPRSKTSSAFTPTRCSAFAGRRIWITTKAG